MAETPDLPVYWGDDETTYSIRGSDFAAAVRSVIAQESAPREPAQERQDGGADPLREPDYMAKVRQDLLSEYKRGFIAGLIWGRDNTSGISITRRDEFNREIARREGA